MLPKNTRFENLLQLLFVFVLLTCIQEKNTHESVDFLLSTPQLARNVVSTFIQRYLDVVLTLCAGWAFLTSNDLQKRANKKCRIV